MEYNFVNVSIICIIVLLIVVIFQNMTTMRYVKQVEDKYNSIKFGSVQ